MTQRFGDPDVVALVANDLSRLHRKGWRVGDMMDHLERLGIALVVAAPGREVDTSTPQGKMFVQFTAMLDEYYAEDISQRAKDSVTYRKSLGKHIGQAPYGTIKKEGFLVPSSEGAWLLSDGRFVGGTPDKKPTEDALWRSYYDGAKRILELYAEGKMGIERIAYQMGFEGYPFRARRNQPRRITEDDVRRVVSNWDKYGGIVTSESSKDRKAYEQGNVAEIVFIEERAVFPVDLLRQVAQVRYERSVRPADKKTNIAKFYPLSQITYCAHCEKQAEKYEDIGYRSTLTGTHLSGNPKYRHKPGVKCGCQSRSVPCELIEEDFERLIKLLIVSQETLDLMKEMSVQIDKSLRSDNTDPEKEKQDAIAICKRRIDAAIALYGDGEISRDEYLRRKQLNEREIAHWQSYTTEAEQNALELNMCLQAVETISRLWDMSDDEDRQGMIRNLFTYVIYDLDKQRIIDFRLKPWADRYLVLRTALYAEEEANKNALNSQISERHVPHTGSVSYPRYFERYFLIRRVKSGIHIHIESPEKAMLRQQVLELRAQGLSYPAISRALNISEGTAWNYAHKNF